MKINFTSPYDKKLKYKIYGLNGKKRKLLKKGKFLHNTEEEVTLSADKLIVRVQRCSMFFAFLNAVYIGIANFCISPRFASDMFKWYSLYPFEEICLVKLRESDAVQITYNKSPLIHSVYKYDTPVRNMVNDYLTSSSAYNNEYSGRKTVNIVLYVLAVIFWIALILSICLTVRFLVFDK
ncbi:MAG: hypothetical protein LUD27_07545 [Clostridia bacterium]|nr:hypothetical protein [Clostridia bacterium]